MVSTAETDGDRLGWLWPAIEPRLDHMTRRLIDRVAGDLGRSDGSDHWRDVSKEGVREFLTSLADGDEERILAPGGVFEGLGVQVARSGVSAEDLMMAIRMSIRLTQAEVHRALLQDGRSGPEETFDLLERVLLMGELVVTAARRGHDRTVDSTTDDEVLAGQLAAELLRGGASAPQIAARLGWSVTLVAAAVATPGAALRIRERSERPVAWSRRQHDVVLALHVESTTRALRSGLADDNVVVGTAVPLAEFADSLELAERAAGLDVMRAGPVFADDHLLEVVVGSGGGAMRALRRRYFAEVDRLPDEVRTVLLATLREWLLHWGHRPSVAAALYVHPQTVSGRIARLRDLVADDLEDPRVRSELLVLLLSDGPA